MLVTTCKHCGARFRVLPAQLNQRQGQVRCGECQQVFNGFESLKGYRDDDEGLRQAYPSAEASPAAATRATEPTAKPEQPQEREPDIATPEGGPAREAPPTEARVSAAGRGAPVPAAAYVGYGEGLPGRASRAWSFAVALLAVVLGLQLAYAYRAPLAQRYPSLRPALESACARAGCTVAWINDPSALKLEESELVEVPGKAGQIALQARIRNLSASPQEFPHVELTLSDVNGQTAIRRVLRPSDYLGRTPALGDVMAAGAEVQLSLRFETGSAKATGYELLLFYP